MILKQQKMSKLDDNNCICTCKQQNEQYQHFNLSMTCRKILKLEQKMNKNNKI